MSLARSAQKAVVGLLLLLASLGFSSTPLWAQNDPVAPPPMPSQVDGRGVDLTTGKLVLSAVDVAIGPSDHHGLSLSRQWTGYGWRIAQVPTISGSYPNPIVSFGGQSIPMEPDGGGNYKSVYDDGATLNGGLTTFVSSDGTEVHFTNSSYIDYSIESNQGIGTEVIFPDGVKWTYHYQTASVYTGPDTPEECISPPDEYTYWQCVQEGAYYRETFNIQRLVSINSSAGYQIKLTHASNTFTWYDQGSYFTITKATAINNAVEYCDPAASSCTLSGSWPEATYSWGGYSSSVTSPTGGTTNYTYTISSSYQNELTGIRPPGASSNLVTYGYTSDKVSSVTAGAGTWTYGYGTYYTTVTDPFSQTQTTNYNGDHQVTSFVAGGQTTTYAYCTTSDTNCPEGLLKQVTLPEGNYVQYAYDARGNQTSATRVAKSGSGLSNIVTSAVYPSSCTYQKTCNKPTSTTDARGQTTDYTYDTGHGGVLTVTVPADASGVRPQTRIGYGSLYAYYKNSAGTIVAGPATFVVPTSVASCRTATTSNPASCAGTADERLMAISYITSGAATDGQPNAVYQTVGNWSTYHQVNLTYDNNGNVVTTASPQLSSADATLTSYRADRRVEWQIGPDPDGTESALYPAVKYTYRSDGQIDKVETGTVTAQSSSAMSSFSLLTRQQASYDGYQRPARQTLSDGSTAYQVTDQVYDAANRPLCSVLRMGNLASPGSLLTGCSPPQTTSSNGPDRVTYNTYDALGRVYKVTSAYGISGTQADDVTKTFTSNGQVATVTDAEGNKTSYTYDGHDRLAQTNYPSTTKGAGTSSSSDYEQTGYDANGNVTSFRTRAGETLSMTYDNLNRLVVKGVPQRTSDWDPYTRDVYYGYDLFGDMTYARFDSASGEGITNAFNALGQLTSTTNNMDSVSRTLSYQYDVAGNFTRLTYPDGNYVDYFRHAGSGGLYYSMMNGGSPLFYTPRDAAGRTAAVYRWGTTPWTWNAVSAYSYDGVSRLNSYWYDLPASTYEAASSFAYNPASQIVGRTAYNDAYAWSGQASASRSYSSNGLDEYSAVGGTTYYYDANHNLTSDGTNSYAYDVENRLVYRSVGSAFALLRYDPLGRLYETYGSSTGATHFLYDGDDLVAEYDGSSNLLRRYVHGPGAGDDPLAWFEGSGVTNSERRYLYSDERGSINLVTDADGTALAIDSYDEQGIPGTGNIGRFQYTGQAWLPELGMYYYKARMYSPALGRFMQTDPIGYGDGMNMYAYVHGDAVNGVDPSGLADITVTADRPCTSEEFEQLVRGSGKPPTGASGPHCDNGQAQDSANADYMNKLIAGASIYAPGVASWDTVFQDQVVHQSEPGMGHNGGAPLDDVAKSTVITVTRNILGAAAARVAGAISMLITASPTDTKDFINTNPHGIHRIKWKLSDTVANHAQERPYVNSNTMINQIVSSGPGVPDPGGIPGGLRYDVPGRFNGSSGIYELVIDPSNETVYHFLFRSGS